MHGYIKGLETTRELIQVPAGGLTLPVVVTREKN